MFNTLFHKLLSSLGALLISGLAILIFFSSTVLAEPISKPPIQEILVIGYSTKGVPVIAKRYGNLGGKVVVAIGSIHGNEKSGLSITKALAALGEKQGYTLWIIDRANPDGTALDQRGNARGVDLNRNFNVGWKKIPCISSAKNCSGPYSMSEPETTALAAFMLQVQPRMVIFYHSVGNTIDTYTAAVASPKALAVYSKVSGIPRGTVSCGPAGCTGTATKYIFTNIPTSTPFVIELPCDSKCLTPTDIQRHVRAFWAAAAQA
jgi:protein MpaA